MKTLQIAWLSVFYSNVGLNCLEVLTGNGKDLSQGIHTDNTNDKN